MNVIADRIVRKNPFLRDWSNYGIVDIFNPVAIAQYQHYVALPFKHGMVYDFRDLRFFEPDGTEIPFWIEQKTNGSIAGIWFKAVSSSLKSIYVFYGNRDAVSQSDGSTVFKFFDDFPGSSLDTTAKWTVWVANGSYSVSNSVLTVTGGSSGNYEAIGSKFKYLYPVALRALIYFSSDSASGDNSAFGLDERSADGSSSGGEDAAVFQAENGSKYYATAKNGTYTKTARTASLASVYHLVDILWESDSSVKFRIDGGAAVQNTTNIPAQAMGANAFACNSRSVYIDFVGIREYSTTEPVCQFNQYGLRT